ncbi:MAG: enoyl-CoA hydratase [Alphaproteobacteria bacterium]|nr:enoyl-CoA hydratase [Alphaproteobacteria bacterium]
MSASLVTYEAKDGIAILTMNRPDKLNALSPELGQELLAAWRRFNAGEERVAILTGAGAKAFTAGADLSNPPELWSFVPGAGIDVDKPIIAAINGLCVGGGWILAQHCDLAVAAESARFIYPEAKVAISGGFIAGLAARIPHKIAMEFMLLGEEMSARRAYEVGMVNKVVPAEQVMPAAMEYARKLADNAPLVLAMLKRFVRETLSMGPSERLGRARRETLGLLASEDFKEGVAAFREKRKPRYRGR